MRSAARSTGSLLAGAHPHTTTIRHPANRKDPLTLYESAEAHATGWRSRASNLLRKASSPRALKML
jgi:hypothetical protein